MIIIFIAYFDKLLSIQVNKTIFTIIKKKGSIYHFFNFYIKS